MIIIHLCLCSKSRKREILSLVFQRLKLLLSMVNQTIVSNLNLRIVNCGGGQMEEIMKQTNSANLMIPSTPAGLSKKKGGIQV